MESVIKGYLVEIAPNEDLKDKGSKQRKEDEGKAIVNNETYR